MANKPLMVPPGIVATSPQVCLTPRDLPLNLIALIISHMDDLGDIARLTCTCRLLYYMALPKLWERITLRSYAEMRYMDGRPEGFGSGSPFAMGLNALVTGNVATYVRSLTLTGQWKELDTEEYLRGRVPDNAMMLNITIRAALDKMPSLQTFKWELNPKLSQTVYQGLAARPNLTSLTLRFPSKRMARPTTTIPPMKQLRKFVAYDLDPLAYPDDISLLLSEARDLEDLTMHWNPRIRRDAEQSVNLHAYFGKLIAAGRALHLKHMGFFNMFAVATGPEFDDCVDTGSLLSMTIMNMQSMGDESTVFIDDTWRRKSNKALPRNIRVYRGDVFDKQHAQMLAYLNKLEEMYLVNTSRYIQKSPTNGTPSTPTSADPPTPKSRNPSPYDLVNVASDYLAVIQSARSMRKLLLSDQWLLDPKVVLKICEACPNLEQLGVALSDNGPESTRVFFPSAPKLVAYRSLFKPNAELQDKFDTMDEDDMMLLLAHEYWRPMYRNLKYLGVGSHYVFKLGSVGKHPSPTDSFKYLRHVDRLTWDDVRHIEIWGMDSGDIIG